ncbi:MAG: hypothetical protein RL095_1262 [Verrucomicrobiota bacterium]|jgi:putative lipoic acid-binding regulatory protein
MSEIKFPVDWHFKIIGLASADLASPLAEVLHKHGCSAVPVAGSISSNGNYRTWNVSVVFLDRAHMETMSQALAQVPGVKMVL